MSEHGLEGAWEETEVLHKSSVKVVETQESLELLDWLWLGPVSDGLDLPLVVIHTDDVTKKLDRGAMELTFLELKVELMFPYQYIVYVHYDKSVEELPEHLVHEPLENRRRVGEAIQHKLIFIVASRGDERSLPLIALPDWNKIIHTLQVQLREDVGPTSSPRRTN